MGINKLFYKSAWIICILSLALEPTIQLQYLLFGSQLISFNKIILAFLVLTVLCGVFIALKRKKLTFNKMCILLFLNWFVISAISTYVNTITNSYGTSYYISSYTSLFLPLIMLFIVFFFKDNVDNCTNNYKIIYRAISIMAIIFMCIGLRQLITGNLGVPLTDTTGNDLIHLTSFGENTRLVSLFQFPSSYGFFIMYATILWFSKLVYSLSNKFKKLLLFLLCVFGLFSIYQTYIRTNVIIVLLSMAGVVFIKKSRKYKNIVGLSLIICAVIFIYYYRSYISGINHNMSNINDNASLIIRFQIWIELLKTYTFNGSVINFFFGSAVSLDPRVGLILPIDNFFVSTLLYNGVLGLFAWVVLNGALFFYCIKKTFLTKSIYWVTASAMYFSFPTAFLSSTIPLYPLIVIMAIIQERTTCVTSKIENFAGNSKVLNN